MQGSLIAFGTEVNVEQRNIVGIPLEFRDFTVDFDFGEEIALPAGETFWLALYMQADCSRVSVFWAHRGVDGQQSSQERRRTDRRRTDRRRPQLRGRGVRRTLALRQGVPCVEEVVASRSAPLAQRVELVLRCLLVRRYSRKVRLASGVPLSSRLDIGTL